MHPSGTAYEWRLSPEDVGVKPLLDFKAVLGLDHDAVGAAKPKTKVPGLLTRKDYSQVPVPTLRSLTFEIERYIANKPSKRERHQQGIDGHAVEYAIVCRLVNDGCSDEEIAAFFDTHQLPRHMEERARPRGYGWLAQCIHSAREGREGNRGVAGVGTASASADTHFSMYVEKGHYPPSQDVGSGSSRSRVRVDHTRMLRAVEGQQVMKWLRDVASDQGCSVSGARKARVDLEDSGYIELKERRTATGREKTVHLTEKGQRYARPFEGRFAKMSRFVPLARLTRNVEPSPERSAPEEPKTASKARAKTKAKGSTASRALNSRVTAVERPAKPNTPKDISRENRIETLRARNHINNQFRLSFVGRSRTFYFQLLTPPEEWISCEFYEQVMVDVDPDGIPIYRSFTVVGNDSPYLSYFAKPKERVFALGVALQPTTDGFEIAAYVDEEGLARPSIGVIAQAWFNFFVPLSRLPRPHNRAIQVKRTGSRRERMYTFADAGAPIPASSALDLQALLVQMDTSTFDHTSFLSFRKAHGYWPEDLGAA